MSSSVDLSARALLTLQEARRYVFRDEDDASRDELLVDAVNYASSAIWDHCEREFLDTTATPGPDTRDFAISFRGLIDLAPYDLRSASAVVLYTDRDVADQVTLAADQYRLLPLGGVKGGTYWRIRTILPLLPEKQFGFGWQASVTGEWGLAAIPETVKLACAQWVENLVKNPGSFASQAMSGFVVTPDVDPARSAGMPPATRHRLVPWARGPGAA